MNMSRNWSKVCAVLGAMALTVGLAASANANVAGVVVPGSYGMAAYNGSFSAASNCLLDATSSLRNGCGSDVNVNYALTTTPGSKVIFVRGGGVGSSCQAVVADLFSGSTVSSGVFTFTAASGQQLNMSGLNVPSGGYLYIFCTLKPGGKINSIYYDL